MAPIALGGRFGQGELGREAQRAVQGIGVVDALQLDQLRLACVGDQHGAELDQARNRAARPHPFEHVLGERGPHTHLEVAAEERPGVGQQARADLPVEAAAGRDQGHAQGEAGAEHPQRAPAAAQVAPGEAKQVAHRRAPGLAWSR